MILATNKLILATEEVIIAIRDFVKNTADDRQTIP